MNYEIFKIMGAVDCVDAIGEAELGQSVRVERTEVGGVSFFDTIGRPLGRVTGRHKLARRLADGSTVALHASINMVAPPDDQYPHGKVHIRIMLGAPGETYTPPAPVEPRSYPVEIVGESFYQAAISRCRVGDRVKVWHEINNPHDELALAVRTLNGEKIGHLSRDSWIRDVVFRDGKGVSALILSINRGRHFTGVVLRVDLDGTTVEKWPQIVPSSSRNKIAMGQRQSHRQSGLLAWLSRLFQG